ncbi:serine/threonine-protein kinase [Enhygromyxa salina]|nr:serine/threonine-protein kinase [Enhygromyxa salina]
MASPFTPGSLPGSLPSSWGPLVDEGRALPVERAARLVAARLGISIGDAADQLNALPSRHRYLLLQQIASTHRSVVYAAVDRALVREVAIKLHLDQDEHAQRGVMTEVRTMSELEHANIVRVFDVEQQDGWLYSVTELCDADMHAWSEGREWTEIIARVLEAGAGLAHVHAAGFVHGDVKPTNIMIKDGLAKLGDFGFATKPRLGPAPYVVGTPGFIAPEVAAGERCASGDVFALAASAWACLFEGLPFGTPPPRASAEASVLVSIERAIRGELAQPKRVPAGMSRSIVAVIERDLHPDPRERPGLGEWLAELSFVLRAVERMRKLRRSWPAVVGGVVVIGLLGVGGYASSRSDREREDSSVDESTQELALDDQGPRNPGDEALEAARAGDSEAVLAALNRALADFDEFSAQEQVRLADLATSSAEELEQHSKDGVPELAWTFAAIFHRRVGQTAQAEAAWAAARGERP